MDGIICFFFGGGEGEVTMQSHCGIMGLATQPSTGSPRTCGLFASSTYFGSHFIPWVVADFLFFQIPELDNEGPTSRSSTVPPVTWFPVATWSSLSSLEMLHSSAPLQKYWVLIRIPSSKTLLTNTELNQTVAVFAWVANLNSGQEHSGKMDF